MRSGKFCYVYLLSSYARYVVLWYTWEFNFNGKFRFLGSYFPYIILRKLTNVFGWHKEIYTSHKLMWEFGITKEARLINSHILWEFQFPKKFHCPHSLPFYQPNNYPIQSIMGVSIAYITLCIQNNHYVCLEYNWYAFF